MEILQEIVAADARAKSVVEIYVDIELFRFSLYGVTLVFGVEGKGPLAGAVVNGDFSSGRIS